MTTSEARQQTRILVQAAAAICENKKGEDTRILELDPVDSGLSDFFLITSASNDRQAIAIADEIEFHLKKVYGVMPNGVEGRQQGEWILLDYVDFVVHVFLTERRAFYDIERLRKSARPLSPAELTAELTAKTLKVRAKTPAKKAAGKKAVAVKPVAKKPAAKVVLAKKAVAKTAAAKPVTKKTAAKKAAAKPAAKKAAVVVAKKPVKKAVVKPVAVKKAVKAVAKKAAVKAAPVKKATAKKVPAKKAPAKKVPSKKAATKKTRK
jgi:ribosome-associated protein